jgi:hypothetical protein
VQSFFPTTACVAAMIYNWHVSARAKANDAKKLVLLATLRQAIHVDQVHLSPTISEDDFIGFSFSSDVNSWISPKTKKMPNMNSKFIPLYYKYLVNT